MTERSIVFNLRVSAERMGRYWDALQRMALSRLGNPLPKNIPARSFLWSHLSYSDNPRKAISPHPLSEWFRLERTELSGFPMAAPGRFLGRFGFQDTPECTYVVANQVSNAPNDSLNSALEMIDDVWPEAGAEIRGALLGAAWIRSPAGAIVSGCGPRRFGLIILNADHFSGASPHELATALIHETAHHALFVETARDPLIPDDFAKPLWSPLRKQMRPAIGVVHAVFTIARIGQWASRLRERNPGPFVTSEIERLRERYFSGLRETMESLRTMRFTDQGRQLIEDIKGSIGIWEVLRG